MIDPDILTAALIAALQPRDRQVADRLRGFVKLLEQYNRTLFAMDDEARMTVWQAVVDEIRLACMDWATLDLPKREDAPRPHLNQGKVES